MEKNESGTSWVSKDLALWISFFQLHMTLDKWANDRKYLRFGFFAQRDFSCGRFPLSISTTASLRLLGGCSAIVSSLISGSLTIFASFTSSSFTSSSVCLPIASWKTFVFLIPQISSPTASSTPSITYSVCAASCPPVTVQRTCAIEPG